MSWNNLKEKFDFAIENVQKENFDPVAELRIEVENFFKNDNKLSSDEISEFKKLNNILKEEIDKKISDYRNELEFAMNIPKNFNKYLSAMSLVEEK